MAVNLVALRQTGRIFVTLLHMTNALHRMKYFLILLFILSGTGLYAQVDNPTGGIAIPKSKTPITPTPPKQQAEAPSPKAPNKKSFLDYDLEGAGLNAEKKSGLVSRGAEYQAKAEASIRPRGESNEAYRGNIDFGMIKTKSPYIVLNMRDFGAEDGDRVKVTLNDHIILSEVLLNNSNQAVMITLFDGFNNILIEALNQGTSGPNTAEFSIYDNKEEKLGGNEWNLATGFHAKFLVLKE